ncbi:MAG: TRAP transporter substrate-binding protein [Burkholderiaceae bacterium]|nr:TRAP transporter substrate-binding protein [Burkholderiaceae bacterium]
MKSAIAGGFALVVSAFLSLTAPASVQAAPRVTIKYAHCCPPTQAFGVYALDFADRVKKKSKGEIVVEVLHGGVMGTEQVAAQKVQLGVIQMGGITGTNVAQLAPSLNFLGMPYMFTSIDQVTGPKGVLRAGPFRDELNKRVQKESGTLRVVGGYTNAFRSMFAKNKCISKVGDLKGLKFRAPKNPIMTAMWDAWGISTYPIAWGETFGAIGSGVVDAFDSPTEVILTMGFHQHIKYITESTYLPLAAVVIVNTRFFDSLAEADRKLILEAANEADAAHAEWLRKVTADVHKGLVAKGVKFCELENVNEWQSRAQGAWPKLYKLVGGGKEWVDTAQRYLKDGKL